MSEHDFEGPDFEGQMAALYRDVQPRTDDAAFLAHIELEISRQRRTRRWVMATLGTGGASTTLILLARSEVGALLVQWSEAAHALFADVSSIPWNAAAALVLVSLLVLPAFVRALVDPK